MERIQQRVQAISHQFNAQNTASTLWALARIGEPQGERMLAPLYLRAEETSAQLNAQVNPNQVRLLYLYKSTNADAIAAGRTLPSCCGRL